MSDASELPKVEIGPGKSRLPGFKTMDIVKGPNVDYVGDARKLPFRTASLGMVYAAHVIEHFDWWLVEEVIAEWARVLAPGGELEVHFPDAAPLMRALLEWEDTGEMTRMTGKWKLDLHRGDPFLAASGRIMNYPKGGNEYHRHKAILTGRYVRQCMERAGLVNVRDAGEPKGESKHRQVNLGLIGTKPLPVVAPEPVQPSPARRAPSRRTVKAEALPEPEAEIEDQPLQEPGATEDQQPMDDQGEGPAPGSEAIES